MTQTCVTFLSALPNQYEPRIIGHYDCRLNLYI